jgi:hypothetical protein
MDEHKKWGRHDSPEDIAAIFETISDKVPSMIRGILDSLFSPESAANMGKAVAEFRKTLIEGGIPEDEAMAMTREYLGTLTKWQGIMKEAKFGSFHKEE